MKEFIYRFLEVVTSGFLLKYWSAITVAIFLGILSVIINNKFLLLISMTTILWYPIFMLIWMVIIPKEVVGRLNG